MNKKDVEKILEENDTKCPVCKDNHFHVENDHIRNIVKAVIDKVEDKNAGLVMITASCKKCAYLLFFIEQI